MGSFEGHVQPGIFFIFFSIRWLICILSKIYQINRHNYRNKISGIEGRQSFKSSTTYPSSLWPNCDPEAWLKIICCSIGVITEFYVGFDSNWKFIGINNMQHMTMFFFFGLAGIFEVILFKQRRLISNPNGVNLNLESLFPPDLDYFLTSIAVFVEGLTFVFHIHGDNPLDIQLHELLVVSISMTLLSVLIEWKYRDKALAAIFRALCFLLQGTWFIQIGFILYNPLPGAVPWKQHDHNERMIISTIFCFHIAGGMLLALLIGFAVRKSNCSIYESNGKIGGKKVFINIPNHELTNEVTECLN